MKFNLSTNAAAETKNHMGATAYKMTPELELYTAVATCMVDDSYYEKQVERLSRIRQLIAQCKPEFVAKLAVYARTEMNLRSIPVVLAVELAKIASGNNLVSKTINGVVQRADEIKEILAYYQVANKRTGTKKLNGLAKQVQKGLAMAFNKFDEYQFAKYNAAAEIKMKDALFLVHPKAKDDAQQLLFTKIAKDELETPYTWETVLSELGKQKFETEEAKKNAVKEKWQELIDSKKLGYMALLRNLRNILECDVSKEHILAICEYLTNKTAVSNSRQLPFRFLAAYRELKAIKSGYTSYVMKALEEALTLSIQNMSGFDIATKVVIACDVSGSMQKPISAKSKILLYDIGLLLGMLLQSACDNVLAGMFGDTWKIVPLPSTGILANVDNFYNREGEVGYSTNGYLVIKDLIEKKYVADKIMLFTDTQLWDSNTNNRFTESSLCHQWKAYKKIAPAAKLYVFDLAGYGNTPLKLEQDNVHLIAGWSDKVFDVMDAIENGENAIQSIEKVEL